MKEIREYFLIILGDLQVLTNTPFKDEKPLTMLPGRAEYLRQLQKDREERGGMLYLAIAANKGGVAFAKQTEEEALAEVAWTAEQIGADTYRVCFAHPDALPGLERYANPEELKRRKPEIGMFEEIIKELGVERERVLVVGTYADDCKAAQKAGLDWQVHGHFFAVTKQSPAQFEKRPGGVDPWLDAEGGGNDRRGLV